MQEKNLPNTQTKKIVNTAIWLVWSWGFFYAPVYFGLHDRLIDNIFGLLGVLCIAIPVYWLKNICEDYWRNLLNNPPHPLTDEHLECTHKIIVCGWGTISAMMLGFWGQGNLSCKIIGVVFLLIGLSLAIKELPFWFHVCIPKIKALLIPLKGLFKGKKIPAFILATLTILTALFQCVQVMLSLLNH